MGEVEYASATRLAELEPAAVVVMTYKRRVRCLRMPHSRYVKLEFADPELTEEFIRIGREKYGLGDWHPSGFADLFHDPWPSARVPISSRLGFPQSVIGAWEELRDRTPKCNLKEFDVVSAYGWAGLRPLPILRSGWNVSKWSGPGIYLVKRVTSPSVELPPHLRALVYRPERTAWVTSEEIDELGLHCEILRGIRFAKWWEPKERIDKLISSCPVRIWKRILRAYWGTWAAPAGITSRSVRTQKVWTLDNPKFDPVAAHYIISRVRNRMAHVARDSVYIYVDSVITQRDLPVGANLGDWSLKNRFVALRIQATGRYTDPAMGLSKHSGSRDIITA